MEASFRRRKRPKQRRSRETVEAILEATTRVLMEEGYEKANTNHIAQVAGVSVGTLYQYFPNKESLVLAVVEEHSEEMISLLRKSVQDLAREPLKVAVRTYVEAMLAMHQVNPSLHRELIRLALHLGYEDIVEYQREAVSLVKDYLCLHADAILPRDMELAAFMLVTMVEGVFHSALVERPEWMDTGALTEEICAMVLRYLLGSSG